MKVKRCGAERNHGWATVIADRPKIGWDERQKTVVLEVHNVTSVDNWRTTHHWRIMLTQAEIHQIAALAVPADSQS